MNKKLVARVVPASHGIAWLVQSMSLLRAQPTRLLFITILMQFIMSLTQLPMVGLFVVISVPALSAGLLQAFRYTEQGGRPAPAVLFKPLFSGSHSGRLLTLGALMFVLGMLTASFFLGGDEALLDPELLARIEQGEVEALAALDQGTLRRMLLAFLIGISISGTLSYMTIPLIWFQNRKIFPALGEGLRALVANWKPFTVLGLGLMALLVPVGLVAGVLAMLAGSAGLLSIILVGLVMILVLAFQLMLFGTQYCAFRDIFGLETESMQPVRGDGNHFVA